MKPLLAVDAGILSRVVLAPVLLSAGSSSVSGLSPQLADAPPGRVRLAFRAGAMTGIDRTRWWQFPASTWRVEAAVAPGGPRDPYRPLDAVVAAWSFLRRIEVGAGRRRSARLRGPAAACWPRRTAVVSWRQRSARPGYPAVSATF